MDKVRLVGIDSKCMTTKNGWQELYNIKIDVNNISFDFDSDLKNGVRKETEKIFSPSEYDYSCFESMYGRTPKAIKSMYN